MKKVDLHQNRISAGFTAPDPYFEQFTVKIPAEVPVVPISRFRWEAAAAVAALALMIPALNNYNETYPENAVEQYLISEMKYHQEELISELDREDLDQIADEIYTQFTVPEQAIDAREIEHLIY